MSRLSLRHEIVCLLFLGSLAPFAQAQTAESWASLSVRQQRELSDRKVAFDLLSAADQEKLRSLHATVSESDPEAQSLRKSLERFERWLATLAPADRARLQNAKSDEERLKLARDLVTEQTARLDVDLEPLRSFEQPAPVGPGSPPQRPPVFLRQRLGALEDQRQLIAKLEPMMTEPERIRLQGLRRVPRSLFVMALATKYDVPIPSSMRELQPPIFQMFTSLIENPEEILGDRLPRAMEGEARKVLGAFMVDILLLPELEDAKEFKFLQQQPEVVRSGIEAVSEVNIYAGRILIQALYYSAHPEEAPDECRDSLEMINSTVALTRFGRVVLRDKNNKERQEAERKYKPPRPKEPRDE